MIKNRGFFFLKASFHKSLKTILMTTRQMFVVYNSFFVSGNGTQSLWEKHNQQISCTMRLINIILEYYILDTRYRARRRALLYSLYREKWHIIVIQLRSFAFARNHLFETITLSTFFSLCKSHQNHIITHNGATEHLY